MLNYHKINLFNLFENRMRRICNTNAIHEAYGWLYTAAKDDFPPSLLID